VSSPRPYEVRISPETVSDLRDRLAAARWPEQHEPGSWALGTDLAYARELCAHWRDGYEFARLERLDELGSAAWRGIHHLRLGGGGGGDPVVLLHGWPSGPIEYVPAARLLRDAGREVIVPSLPGYGWSEDPGAALSATGMAQRLGALLEQGLGLERYVLAGGDWGALIAARMAFDRPDRVSGLYVSTPGTLPASAELDRPPLSEDEVAYAQRAQRWLRREGHHIAIQSLAPDAVAPALGDSPAGLACYLLEKYRRWSDSGGEVERRFSKDELCDFLTMFWATGTIAPSMRLYWGERHERWRLQPGERITVPAAIGVFPGDSEGGADSNTLATLNPPREWSQRVLSDLRRWTVHPSGGHFAAFEEPEAYVEDLEAFLEAL
jgi:pimeloyl-ACP methyl ester carboxylesterase